MALKLTLWDELAILLKSRKAKVLALAAVVLLFLLGMIIKVTDFKSVMYYFNDIQEVVGYVDTKAETNYTAFNRRPINRYFFTFQLGDDIYQNYSFSSQLVAKPGDRVKIEYIVSRPEVSRILTAKNGQFGFIPLLIALPIVFLLMYFLKGSVNESVSMIKLLHNRVEDVGEYHDKTEIWADEHGTQLYTLEYRYRALEEMHSKFIETRTPEKFGEEEPLFYSKNKPDEAVLFQELPDNVLKKLGIEILDAS